MPDLCTNLVSFAEIVSHTQIKNIYNQTLFLVPRRTFGLFELSSQVDLLSDLQRSVGREHPELGHGEGRVHSHVSLQISNLR